MENVQLDTENEILELIDIPSDPTPMEMNQLLNESSSRLGKVRLLEGAAQTKFEHAKARYGQEYEKQLLLAEGRTVREREAKAKLATATLEMEMLAAQAEWNMLKRKVQQFEDRDLALRKAANVLVEALKAGVWR